ncbi:MAG: hypothetical protein ABJA67_05565, partial [Chthonomonadales bacterium]
IGLRAWTQPRAGNSALQWEHSVPGLVFTTDQFFGALQTELKAGLETRTVPLDGLSFGPQGLFETRSMLARRQEYFEARYKHNKLFLYAAETPTGFYVSLWIFSKYLSWLNLPVLSWFARLYFSWQTLFQYDATALFCATMQELVLQIMDEEIDRQKLPPLQDIDRKPVLHPFYASSHVGAAPSKRKTLPI